MLRHIRDSGVVGKSACVEGDAACSSVRGFPPPRLPHELNLLFAMLRCFAPAAACVVRCASDHLEVRWDAGPCPCRRPVQRAGVYAPFCVARCGFGGTWLLVVGVVVPGKEEWMFHPPRAPHLPVVATPLPPPTPGFIHPGCPATTLQPPPSLAGVCTSRRGCAGQARGLPLLRLGQ